MGPKQICQRAPSVPSRRQRRAFSMVEVLVVMVLIGIIAGWATSKIDLAKFRADAAGRVVRGTLQQAQRLAILRQYDVIVSFDTTEQRLRVHEDVDNDGVIDPGERVRWKSIEDGVRFNGTPSGVAGVAANALAGSNIKVIAGFPSLVFRRDGSASSDAEVYVLGAANKPTSFRAVTVIQSTGRVDWYRYGGTAWAKGGA